MDGTVTITLKDFQELVDANKNASGVQKKTRLAAKELEVFLSFLCRPSSTITKKSIIHSQNKSNDCCFNQYVSTHHCNIT